MRRTVVTLVMVLFISFAPVCAQVINNTLAYKNIAADGYFRFTYDNDFFAAIDEYYTQGIDAELVLPGIERFFTSRLLFRPYSYTRYGAGIQHNGYTPSSISSDNILYNDHPFGGVLLLKTFSISTDTIKRQRFSSSMYGGVIGPAAGASEMQVFIHRGLGNIMPQGWQHQVRNDVAVNYLIDYEKQLLAHGNYLNVSGSANLSIGTLHSKAGAGATVMLGYFQSPFGGTESGAKGIQVYAYERPEVSVVGYDAVLQGGMFNKSSPYTLAAGDISRLVFRNRFGAVFACRGIYLEYFAAMVTREFRTGKQHGYGGVQIAVTL